MRQAPVLPLRAVARSTGILASKGRKVCGVQGGNLNGIPTAIGAYTFTVRAADANAWTTSRSYTIIIENQLYLPLVVR